MTTTPARAPGEEPLAGPQVVMRGGSRDSSTFTQIGVQYNFTGPASATMRTLPRDVAAFTGRDAELRQLVAAAAGAAGVVAIHTRGRGTSEQRLALRMILVSAGVTI